MANHMITSSPGKNPWNTVRTGFVILLLTAGPAQAGDALVSTNTLSPETALDIAKASLQACRGKGYQVAVAVVDRMGVPQVMLRDRYAGPHTPDTAQRKAWTAASFRADTLSLAANTAAGTGQSGARMISNALMIGGGVPVVAAGMTVGAVGISGAPTGEDDDLCARAGIEAVKARLELGD
jgi:uncharacterized protein GlcG (DUF336 family)